MLGINSEPTPSAPTQAANAATTVNPGGAVHVETPSSTPNANQSRQVDATVTVVNRPTAEQNNNFREQLKSTEKSMEVTPVEYFEYECSRCHQIVRVKARG
jgi:hypothetical protein